jgi:hypothetical protein
VADELQVLLAVLCHAKQLSALSLSVQSPVLNISKDVVTSTLSSFGTSKLQALELLTDHGTFGNDAATNSVFFYLSQIFTELSAFFYRGSRPTVLFQFLLGCKRLETAFVEASPSGDVEQLMPVEYGMPDQAVKHQLVRKKFFRQDNSMKMS